MRRLAPFLSVVIFCAGLFCLAQAPTRAAGWLPLVASGSGGYTGPNNVTTAQPVSWWSCSRAVSSSYAAAQKPLCDVVLTSTGTGTCTINAGTNGAANMSAIVCPNSAPVSSAASYCAPGCSITKRYDQVGSNPKVQATLANMPLLALSHFNGLPCSQYASGLSDSSGNGTNFSTFSISVVMDRTSVFSSAYIENFYSGSGPFFTTNNNIANSAVMYAGSTYVTVPVTDNQLNTVELVFNGASSSYSVDGAAPTTVNPGSGSTGTVSISTGAPDSTAMYVCEDGYYGSALSTGDQSALNTNQRSATYGYNF